ncbi:hypothetical protein D3C75_536230 [compost metagenome]
MFIKLPAEAAALLRQGIRIKGGKCQSMINMLFADLHPGLPEGVEAALLHPDKRVPVSPFQIRQLRFTRADIVDFVIQTLLGTAVVQYRSGRCHTKAGITLHPGNIFFCNPENAERNFIHQLSRENLILHNHPG